MSLSAVFNGFGKLGVGSLRTVGFMAGAAAALRVGELGIRGVEVLAGKNTYSKAATDFVSAHLKAWHVDCRIDERKDKWQIGKEIVALALTSIAVTEFVSYFECKPPKIYNFVLSAMGSPLRISNQSVVEAWKNLDRTNLLSPA